MNYDQAVIDFLTQPKNLATVFEIARRADQVKNHLVVQFWRDCRTQFASRLQAMDATGRWNVVLPPDEGLLGDWVSCRLTYRAPDRKALYLEVLLEAAQRTSNSRLYYGLHLSRSIQDARETDVLSELMSAVSKLGYVGERSKTWPLFIELGVRLRDDDFLVRYANEPTQLVTEICDPVLGFFERIREPLEAVNERLASVDSKSTTLLTNS